jgi:signal transduction histidine kinase
METHTASTAPAQASDPSTANDLAAAVLEAQEQERFRMAGELHDGPAQALSNAIFQLEIAERTLRADPPAAQRELTALRTILQRELELLRAYINQLRPELASGIDLDEAMRESAADLTQRAGIPVELHLDASPGLLPVETRRAALRVAQEALRNVAKHAGASRAWLTTSRRTLRDGDNWLLEVGDDGQGFEPGGADAAAGRRHFGLRFMRERASLLGAGLEIDSAAGRGTVVRLTVGIAGREEDQR